MSLKEVFKKHYKTILISGFVGGFIYALGMAGFEFSLHLCHTLI